VEVEIISKEEDSERAIEVVQKISRELGLKEVQPKSYIRLVLEKMNA
jgi:adenylate cyclase class IV